MISLKHSTKYTFIIMGFIILIAGYIKFTISENTDKLRKSEIQKSILYAKQITNFLQNNTCPSLIPCIKNDERKRKEINTILQTLQTDNYRNLFVLHQDKNKIFRFILDSDLENPSQFNEPFAPESKEFYTIYKSGKPKIIEQKEDVEDVWVSLLYPILYDNHVVALLVMDLTKTFGEHITNFNSPIQDTVMLLQAFIIMSLIFLAFNAYHAYQLKSSLLKDPSTSAYTKLYRRNFFEEHSIGQYYLIQVNIDPFSRIYSRYGRESSQIILKEFVTYLDHLLTKESIIIRNYDSEFLLIIPKSSINFKTFTKSFFDNLSTKTYLIKNEIVILKIFMCAIVPPKEATSYYELEQIIDKKILELKNLGKQRFAMIDNISLVDIKYKNVEHIKKAIDENRLVCVYQPIVHTKNKKISKYEALVRIVDESDPKKLITPYYFLDSIKETVHYIELSHFVLQSVFDILKTHPDIHLSFNIDISDLYNEEMMKIIRQELYTNRVLANRLTFEILEHSEITDYDHIGVIFKQLKSYGSKIAIDDFGSGYANFAYLTQMDIDIIKIDAVLIKALEGNNEKAKSIITLINDLAISHQLEIVAEFVSTEEIYEILLELGVEYSQGYHLGKPKLWKEHYPTE